MINISSILTLTILAVGLQHIRLLTPSRLRSIRKCLSGACKHTYPTPDMSVLYEARQNLMKVKGGKK